MRYADGNEALPGDAVAISDKYRGVVVACIDRNEYLAGQEQWAYLKQGIAVDTDFGGLVHYTPEATEEIVLLHRAQT